MRPEDLESADEVFLTSTTREVLPVVEIQGLRLKGASEIAVRLREAFGAYTAEYTTRHRRMAKVSS